MSSPADERRGARRVRAPIWAEPEPGRRRPSVTRDQIAQAAMALADAEGLEAVSMRRVAAALGVGTMTLYHYVRTKDDLKTLMGNTIMAELLLDDAQIDPVDWRASITAIARRSRELFRRHRWLVHAVDQGGEIGPNGMRHFEQSLAAVEGTGLDPAGKLELVALVDDLVFGSAYRAAMEDEDFNDIEWRRSALRYMQTQLDSGEFPHIEALLAGGEDRNAEWERIASELAGRDRFEVALEALLDGIEQRLAARGGGP
jgi:AcrR family transcriptional regulator